MTALFKNAVEVPSASTERIGRAARDAGAYVVMGINERRPGTMGTLFNSQVFFDPRGAILGVYRMAPRPLSRFENSQNVRPVADGTTAEPGPMAQTEKGGHE
jgi:predicted amidohydrolase